MRCQLELLGHWQGVCDDLRQRRMGLSLWRMWLRCSNQWIGRRYRSSSLLDRLRRMCTVRSFNGCGARLGMYLRHSERSSNDCLRRDNESTMHVLADRGGRRSYRGNTGSLGNCNTGYMLELATFPGAVLAALILGQIDDGTGQRTTRRIVLERWRDMYSYRGRRTGARRMPR